MNLTQRAVYGFLYLAFGFVICFALVFAAILHPQTALGVIGIFVWDMMKLIVSIPVVIADMVLTIFKNSLV